MNVSKLSLAFAPKYDSPGKRDATKVFQPEAQRFLAHHGVPEDRLFLIDNKKNFYGMRQEVMDVLEDKIVPLSRGQTPVVAFFCHGTRLSLKLGFTTRHVDLLAGAFAGYNSNRIRVPLYACWAGTDRGFAYQLLIRLCEADMSAAVVDGHVGRGHATRRPYVKRYDAIGSPTGGQGGYDIATPSHKSLWRAWLKALKGDLRFRYPVMDLAAIHKELLEAS